MAGVESKLKQRIVGALVLIALAVIFLPMLLKQEDPARKVVVEAPPMPAIPEQPQYPVTEVAVPEPVLDDEWDGADHIDDKSERLIEQAAGEDAIFLRDDEEDPQRNADDSGDQGRNAEHVEGFCRTFQKKITNDWRHIRAPRL